MDKTVPLAAAILLDDIRETEVGTADRRGYDVIYANRQSRLPKAITSMTIAELQAAQAGNWPAKSTASGGYQFMRATLGGLRKELKLRDSQVFTPDLQDRLGYHLLKRRGYDTWMAGKLSDTGFALNLAKEWASFPVLVAVQGQRRMLKRGQSYYAGDGLNKALVSAEHVEALLKRAKAAGNAPKPTTPAEPSEPASEPKNWVAALFQLLAAVVGAVLKGLGKK
jgi:muramidase (phage lysozyme)